MRQKHRLQRFAVTAILSAGICLSPRSTAGQVIEQDSLALVALYNATDGSNWKDNTNWLTGPVSTWFGVGLSGNRISSLSLKGNQLTGTIPAELGNLIRLMYLTLSDNQLTEAIPNELGHLVNLTQLNLTSNKLTGAIPAELGGLKSLLDLYIARNQLSGLIPTELSNSTNLYSLDLSNNQLSGVIPAELERLTNLTHLSLAINQLTGAIPGQLGSLTNLKKLFLDNNRLSGAIPKQLGDLVGLTKLYLNNNQLTGAIPAELGNLTELFGLDLSDNQLTGTLPQSLINLSKLYTFSFSGTNLCESLDEAFQAWLQGISTVESTGCTNVANKERGELPAVFVLKANYPNPVNRSTRIHYALAHAAAVRLAVHDGYGRLITVLVDMRQAAGRYDVLFDASDLASGIYFYTLTAGKFRQTRDMVLMR